MEKAVSTPTISFESALNELEQIVSHLESGNLSLDDALNEFERGIQLSRIGQQQLQQAEQRIQILLNEGINTELTTFEVDDE